MEEVREDGELSGSDYDDAMYNPIIRPDASLYRNAGALSISEDDSPDTEDSDSNSDCCLPKRKKAHFADTRPHPPVHNHLDENNPSKSRKKNNIWSNVLTEDGLMQDIVGVGLKKLDSDRNVESYDYKQALKLHGKYVESDSEEDNDNIEDKKEEDEKASVQERVSFPKKRKHERYKKEKPRYLKEINIDPDWSDEHLGKILAEALFETKADLLVRCVEVLGRRRALDLYDETQKAEKEGGIMVLNGSRRRTSGGVYFHLLKTFEGVGREVLDKIFVNEVKTAQQVRRRKRAHRKINRKQSKESDNANGMDDDGFHITGLFSDDPGGTKCPGSTPVTSPQDSGSENEGKKLSGFQSPPLPLKEVIQRAAIEIEERDSHSQLRSCSADLQPSQEEMDTV